MELIPILRWLAVLAALWAAGLPIAALLFPRFPSRGATLALPVAVLVASLVAFWVGQFQFGPATVGVALVALVGVAGAALRYGPGPGIRRADLREPVAVFLVAFGFLVVLRGGVPEISPTGGEQFLDFAMLNAVLRSEALPPEDPWFAGETVRYYYGGYLSTALVTGISGVQPGIAFNLAVATYYATLVTAAYGLTGAVAEARGYPRRVAGVLGAYLVGFAGNLATPARLLLGLFPAEPAMRYGRVLIEGIRRAPDYRTAFAEATSLSTFDFWRARHVIPDAPSVFPFWTFLNGDLRPHMMSAPFLLLAAACCFAYWNSRPGEHRRRRWLLLGVAGPLCGFLGLANTWDLPTAAGLVGVTVALAPADPAGLLPGSLRDRVGIEVLDDGSREESDGVEGLLRRETGRLAAAGSAAALVGGSGVAWVAPYFLSGTATHDGIGFLPPRSNLGGLVLVYGLFLAIFAAYLAPRGRSLLGAGSPAGYLAAVVAGPGLFAAGVALEFAALGLFGPFLVAGWILLRSRESVGFETALLVAAVGLLVLVELAYVRVWPYDPVAVGWNTLYKVSMQAWLLFGVGAGVAFAGVLSSVAPSFRWLRGRWPSGIARSPARTARASTTVVLVALLVASGTVGAVTSAGWVDEYRERPGATNTLDGAIYLETNRSEEATAIDWLRDREGTPTVVTAPGKGVYDWRAGPSTFTGLPTVVGWRHVAGYHGEAAFERRVEDVEAIYTGSAPERRELLAAYDVTYVYVGPVERERYGEVSFDDLEGVRVAHRSGNVTVYAVEGVGEDGANEDPRSRRLDLRGSRSNGPTVGPPPCRRGNTFGDDYWVVRPGSTSMASTRDGSGRDDAADREGARTVTDRVHDNSWSANLEAPRHEGDRDLVIEEAIEAVERTTSGNHVNLVTHGANGHPSEYLYDALAEAVDEVAIEYVEVCGCGGHVTRVHVG